MKHPIIEKFYRRKVGQPLANGCMPWLGARNVDGYGVYSNHMAHRIMWELEQGPIPEKDVEGYDVCVLHTCDNPWCVNIAHLWLGNRAQNCTDRNQKGRTVGGHAVGMLNGRVKLTPDQVAEIRARYTPGKGANALAKEYGVTHSAIINIGRGRARR